MQQRIIKTTFITYDRKPPRGLTTFLSCFHSFRLHISRLFFTSLTSPISYFTTHLTDCCFSSCIFLKKMAAWMTSPTKINVKYIINPRWVSKGATFKKTNFGTMAQVLIITLLSSPENKLWPTNIETIIPHDAKQNRVV